MSKLKLKTTHDDMHELSEAAFNARDNSKSVKVSLAALKNIVMDHSAMVTALRGELDGAT